MNSPWIEAIGVKSLLFHSSRSKSLEKCIGTILLNKIMKLMIKVIENAHTQCPVHNSGIQAFPFPAERERNQLKERKSEAFMISFTLFTRLKT